MRDATAYGPSAPQTGASATLARNRWAGVARAPGQEILERIHGARSVEDEDCLNLNVFTGGAQGSRPVLVWLHGGGFNAGSSSAVAFDGSALARRNDIVLVTLNHRLGALGYLYLEHRSELSRGATPNPAVLDQVEALRWVQRNIARFGGDPGCVTVFGESGGGWKVCTLLASPAAAGLFHRAIVQSGPAVRLVTPERAAAIADIFLQELGDPDLTALRHVPAAALVSAQIATEARLGPRRNPNRIDGFAPVVDGDTVAHHPFDGTAASASADVPVILGFNRTEMTLFSGRELLEADDIVACQTLERLIGPDRANAIWREYATRHASASAARRLAYAASDLVMLPYLRQILAVRTQVTAGTYVYRFDWETPVLEGRLMSPHFLEVPFVFDTIEACAPLVGPVTPAVRALAARMSGTWAHFASTGVPDGLAGTQGWTRVSHAARPVQLICEEGTLCHDLFDGPAAGITLD